MPGLSQWLQLMRGSSAAAAGGRLDQQATATLPPRGTPDETGLAVSDQDDGLSERMEAELIAFNAAKTGQADPVPLRVSLSGHDGLLAGLCGATWGGCGFIDSLWVRADSRHRGLGTRLLEAAEKQIRLRGCDQVALATYSFQAPAFYIRAGYTECGRRPGVPAGHDQILLTKRLSG